MENEKFIIEKKEHVEAQAQIRLEYEQRLEPMKREKEELAEAIRNVQEKEEQMKEAQ